MTKRNNKKRSEPETGLSLFSAYWLAARPKTLWAGIAPVIIGAAMAFADDAFHALSAACALTGAILIQIGTNYANDYSDFMHGADQPDRVGPQRMTQSGVISPAAMKRVAIFAFALACAPGLYIVWRGGWPFILVGLLSILFGVWYTAGPRPLGYIGLGDVLVLVFFGPVAVLGTYYVQSLRADWNVFFMGMAAGLFSMAILTVNNLRDADQDARAGKKTLAVRLGRGFARTEYLACIIIGGWLLPIAACVRAGGHWFALFAMLTPVIAVPTIRTVYKQSDGPSLNNALAATGRLLLIFSLLFSIGWVL